jgi:uncharacterized protein
MSTALGIAWKSLIKQLHKMKKIILFACLLMATAAFTPTEKVSFWKLEKTYNSTGVPVYSFQGKPFNGTTYDNYDEQGFYREFTIENGLIQKEQGWYDDGQQEREASYENGLLNGKYLIFHRSGNKFQEDNYLDGLLDGRSFRYNCDGSLQSMSDFVSGWRLIHINFDVKPCIKGCKMDVGC